MAAPKRATHLVVHKQLYLSVGGKLQHVKEGSQITLSSEQAMKLGDRVRSITEEKSVDLTAEETKTGE